MHFWKLISISGEIMQFLINDMEGAKKQKSHKNWAYNLQIQSILASSIFTYLEIHKLFDGKKISFGKMIT